MQESTFTNYDQLPLFLNANTVALEMDTPSTCATVFALRNSGSWS